MARSRNIKPGFFLNEELVELPFEVRLLFIGLWTLADRAGRLKDKPKQIKMAIFPADNVDTDASLCALADAGFIIRYKVKGDKYIEILNFLKHQSPHFKEGASTIPAPGKPRACPSQAALIPSSLIPDSLIPGEKTPKPEALARELLIVRTESVLKIKLNFEEKCTVAEAIPPHLIDAWGVYLRSRMLKANGKSRESVIATLTYVLTDFRRDNKKDYELKPEKHLPTLAERDAADAQHKLEPRNDPKDFMLGMS